MKEAILIQELSLSELRAQLQDVVQRENEGLRKEVELLRQDFASSRGVITLKQATTYFDSYVKPETILSYIHYEGLPAHKRGRLWFVYVQDVLDWQIGLIGRPPTKKRGIKKVIPPRHRRNMNVRSSTERTPRPLQSRDENDLTIDSNSQQENRHLIRHLKI